MLIAIFIVATVVLLFVLAWIADSAGSYDFVTPMICVAVFVLWIVFWIGFVIGHA